jgi:molybdopterin-guanine dinucleotide biosynthesis protein A
VIIDAIVLTGGRSSRLDSVPKSGLYFEGDTLLRRTLSAVQIARRTVVVGPVPPEPMPDGVLRTRESPMFGGPAAGIAAGMSALTDHPGIPSDAVLVFACDMPHADQLAALLLDGLLSHPGADGVVPADSTGRRQPLAAAYRTPALAAAIATHQGSGPLEGLSANRLIGSLELAVIEVPDHATVDVDTWSDAHRLGVSTAPPPHARSPHARSPHAPPPHAPPTGGSHHE